MHIGIVCVSLKRTTSSILHFLPYHVGFTGILMMKLPLWPSLQSRNLQINSKRTQRRIIDQTFEVNVTVQFDMRSKLKYGIHLFLDAPFSIPIIVTCNICRYTLFCSWMRFMMHGCRRPTNCFKICHLWSCVEFVIMVQARLYFYIMSIK